MSDPTPTGSEVEALLVERAIEGLDREQHDRLDALLAEDPSLGHDEHDRAAAAVALAMLGDELEPMPSSLRASIHAQVPPHTEGPEPRREDPAPERRSLGQGVTGTGGVGRFGWIVAAAAVLLLVLAELRRPAAVAPSAAPVVVMTAPQSAPPRPVAVPDEPPAPEPTATERRRRLLRDEPDAVMVAWTAAGDPTGKDVSGDVVWSERRQAGFMRFRDLRPNDPRREVYQLWIFDAERDERYPVDGGVFDVDATDRELVVPIDARLPVSRATLFAVTVEPPGGVVVSDRSRIAALATLSG